MRVNTAGMPLSSYANKHFKLKDDGDMSDVVHQWKMTTDDSKSQDWLFLFFKIIMTFSLPPPPLQHTEH